MQFMSILFTAIFIAVTAVGCAFVTPERVAAIHRTAATALQLAYGTLMPGERNHHFCENAVKIEPCTVTGTLYDTGYGFPAYTKDGNTTIQAELITLPVEYWPDIDRLEGYPRLYTREIAPATLPDGTTTEVWIYIMSQLPPHAKLIPDGDWKHRN